MMSLSLQILKTIHFPGGSGQRRQAKYLILPGAPDFPGVTLDTKIVFVEDKNDPSKLDPGWEKVQSNDADSTVVPNDLINKVLRQELFGCRLDLISVFFVTEPGFANRREVFRWDFTVDRDNPISDDPDRTTFRKFSSPWDRLKFIFGIPGSKYEVKGLADNPRAGVYPVLVAIDKPRLVDDERLQVLDALDLALRGDE